MPAVRAAQIQNAFCECDFGQHDWLCNSGARALGNHIFHIVVCVGLILCIVMVVMEDEV